MKLLSLNVEGDKHIESVRQLLERERADTVLLMEVFENNVDRFIGGLYSHHIYAPNLVLDQDEEGSVPGNRKFGVLIASKNPITNPRYFYPEEGWSVNRVPIYDGGEVKHTPVVMFGDVELYGEKYTVGTTHFTWTERGLITEQQRKDIEKLDEYLKKLGEFVLGGDFNLPRNLPGGNELYEYMAKSYKDNIPKEITTTIDPHLHKVNSDKPGKLAFMVDYIWSTPKYEVKNLRFVEGVSDHLGLVCEVYYKGI